MSILEIILIALTILISEPIGHLMAYSIVENSIKVPVLTQWGLYVYRKDLK